MYYRGSDSAATVNWDRLPEGKDPDDLGHFLLACAESADGIHWERPDLGLHEFAGSKRNNIVFMAAGDEAFGVKAFSPFRDENPACAPEARYKAIGDPAKDPNRGIYAFQSPDGLRWSAMQTEPVITDGRFDSQNISFWDPAENCYRAYFRDSWRGELRRFRDVKTCVSEDFLHWSEPEWLEYPGAAAEEIYTNGVKPYFRAPHILLGFPARYRDRGICPGFHLLPEQELRRKQMEESEPRCGTALTDTLFMCSRDGRRFHRWSEAFLRPGPQRKGNWIYGDNYQGWGMLRTPSALSDAPDELSVYATENYRRNSTRIRRYSLRMDGFASAYATGRGGEILTRPFRFEGSQLFLNLSTSASGSIRIEIQDAQETPFDGFTLHEGPENFGDAIEQTALWKSGADLSAIRGKTVRLRFVLRDADLFAFRFGDAPLETEDRNHHA